MNETIDFASRFRYFADQPNPRMVCYSQASAHRKSARDERVFDCHHVVEPPGNAEDINELSDILGVAAVEFIAFYSEFGGVTLFQQSNDDADRDGAALIRFEPIAQWPILRSGLNKWLEIEENQDELDTIFDGAVVFAQIPSSADVFFVSTRGPAAGGIYQFSHDDLSAIFRAESLSKFVAAIMDRTDAIVDAFSGDIRFIDRRGKHWIPKAVCVDK